MGQLQGSRHDSSKVSLSPCHGCFLELSLSYQAKGLVYHFRANHNQKLLGIGHCWYDQQQHILIMMWIPGIWRLTSMNSRYGMAEPFVPSNSDNRPRGWISSASSLQNWELTLKTCEPESISAIVSCPSIITGASLECPTKCYGSGSRKGTGATSGHPLFWAAFNVVSCGLGSGRECWRFTVGCWWWRGWTTFPQFPTVWFNGLAGVAHSQAMWPQP